MATMTVFGNYSKRQHQMARIEDYSRATSHFEKSIQKLKDNYSNGLQYINKLKMDKETTTDEQQLRQIEVDINYLEKHFDPAEMNDKISHLETKLQNHRIRLKKMQNKVATKNSQSADSESVL